MAAGTEKKFKTVKIGIVGAGPVGALLAVFLAKRGLAVDVFERRPDMRKEKISAGRSINLALSVRGLTALAKVGLEKHILDRAIPMKGRMMHAPDGALTFQPYGITDQHCINSVSRATLNKELMTCAEQTGLVTIHFNHKALGMDVENGIVHFLDEASGMLLEVSADTVIGTDGSASAIRSDLASLSEHRGSEEDLDYGYKELVVPPGPNGSFKMERDALHIWPRGSYMLIALPNFDGSFTCTLFLSHEGKLSFASLKTKEAVAELFRTQFADAIAVIPDLVDCFFANPTGHMVTIKCAPWSKGGNVLLLGDAAHAIVPFYGQGMNCGFEDLTVLDQLIEEQSQGRPLTEILSDKQAAQTFWQIVFDRLFQSRKANTDAIADMAVDNFIEMRDKVAKPQFLLEKAVEKHLEKRFPGDYVSRYSLVTFSNQPYSLAQQVGKATDSILAELCADISKPDDVDLSLAAKLIESKLKPVFADKMSVVGLAKD